MVYIRIRKLILRLSLTAMLFSPVLTQATTVLDFATKEGGSPGRVVATVQDGKVRIDQGETGWMLYDGSNDTVFVVDTQRRSYLELTRDEIRQYGEKIAVARKLIDEKLKGMLPEQRAAFEKILGGTSRKAPLIYTRTDKYKKVTGYSCRSGRLMRNGKVQEEVCLAAAKDIKMDDADFGTVLKMYHLMHEMEELGAPDMFPDFSEIDGVPIEITNPNGDFQRISRITQERAPKENFAMPADYQRDNVLEALARQQSKNQQ